MFTAIIGFLAPFIPELLGMGKGWLDHRQELQIMELQLKHRTAEHEMRLEEINVQADIKEMSAVRKPHKSFGIQMLDHAAGSEGMVWKWSFNVAFIFFAMLDWLISFVRPSLTYFIFGLFGVIKVFTMYRVYEITDSLTATVLHDTTWTQFDQDMMLIILGFWFGDRVRKRIREGG